MWALVWLSGMRVQHSWRLGWLSLVLIVPVGLSLLGAGLAFAGQGDGLGDGGVHARRHPAGGNRRGDRVPWAGAELVGRADPVVAAVIVSGVLFGLMHSVNAMLQPSGSTVWRVIVTSMIGIVFGFVYVSSGGNLVLCIVLHWLYDFSLMAPQATEYGQNPIGLIGLLMVVGFLIAVPVGIVRYRDVKRWPTPAAPAAG